MVLPLNAISSTISALTRGCPWPRVELTMGNIIKGHLRFNGVWMIIFLYYWFRVGEATFAIHHLISYFTPDKNWRQTNNYRYLPPISEKIGLGTKKRKKGSHDPNLGEHGKREGAARRHPPTSPPRLRAPSRLRAPVGGTFTAPPSHAADGACPAAMLELSWIGSRYLICVLIRQPEHEGSHLDRSIYSPYIGRSFF
jgi:hypothetical protein